jgi:hypothetical protein
MKVDLFLTADYANVTADGKLNVVGIFNEIYAESFPARHSTMHLVLRLQAELGEYGQTRDLTVKLLDPDGAAIMTLVGQISIPMSKGGVKPQVNVILELKDLVFPRPDIYQFVAQIDKDYKGEVSLYVNQMVLASSTQA